MLWTTMTLRPICKLTLKAAADDDVFAAVLDGSVDGLKPVDLNAGEEVVEDVVNGFVTERCAICIVAFAGAAANIVVDL